jgi:hypothetical protein
MLPFCLAVFFLIEIIRNASITAAISICIGHREKQVSQEAHIHTRSLLNIESSSFNCSLLIISEGGTLTSVATGQPFVHFLHCRHPATSTPEISLIALNSPASILFLLITIA